ncbi:MarR family winged helix-turn-helix transcriptional regulator [Gulosibacter chungangensis]|uniref:MarR family transcriptional regulator n=1 Tax=Gulosibacter chungangensis TaxID=979746 RepID=A0A7J5BFW0_9MICO|nr:MarR family transcriptional regulator [Gulosibacter chungangensis]KAB1644988.1 MarR family transcriptional regulator [Gulosibacter chungangensis]
MGNRTVRPSDAWESLFRAQVSVMRDLREEFTGVGISMNEYDVLFNIYRAPDHRLRLRELNRSVLITQSSVSRLVDRLVSRGFVEKTEDATDARGTIVRLTESGVRAFRKAAAVHTRNINDHMSRALSPEQQTQLHELCTALLQAQNNYVD